MRGLVQIIVPNYPSEKFYLEIAKSHLGQYGVIVEQINTSPHQVRYLVKMQKSGHIIPFISEYLMDVDLDQKISQEI